MAFCRNFVPFLALVFVLFTVSDASRVFLVGGQENGWKIPSSPKEFNLWAGSHRFHMHDILSFHYDGKIDSVLMVSKEDYDTCNSSRPIKVYNDGNTLVHLDHYGPFFFISGAQSHCMFGQKLIVVVLSPKTHHSIETSSLAPASSPAQNGGARGVEKGLVAAVMGIALVGMVAM